MEPPAPSPLPRHVATPPYHVTPRFLAAAEPDAARLIFAALDAAGWVNWSDDLGNAQASDADHRLAVQFLPEEDRFLPAGHVLWLLWARPTPDVPPVWRAEFTDATPHEILLPLITAMTTDPDAVATATPGEAVRAEGDRVLQPLFAAGWLPDRTGQPLTAHAPGLRATLSHHDDAWRLEARPTARSAPLWGGLLETTTPLHLVHALSTALADPSPAERFELPFETGGHVTLAPARRD